MKQWLVAQIADTTNRTNREKSADVERGADSGNTGNSADVPEAKTRRGSLVPGLVALLVVLLLPRFNQRDWLVSGATGTDRRQLGDAEHYIDVIEFIRGNLDRADLRAPFAHRLFGPLLASIVPTSPMTALNLVSGAALIVALIFTLRICRNLGVTGNALTLAGLLFTASFPLFYYGSIGSVEGVTLAVLTVGLYAVISDRWRWLYPLAIIGALTSGITVLTLIVALAVASRSSVNDRGRIRTTAIAAILFAATIIGIRVWMSAATGQNFKLGFGTFVDNITRFRTLGAMLLVLGPPLAVVIWGLRRGRLGFGHPHLHGVRIGVIASAVGLLVGLFSIFVDGRLSWLAYPYLIPLAALLASAVANDQLLESKPITPATGSEVSHPTTQEAVMVPALVGAAALTEQPPWNSDQPTESATGLPDPISFPPAERAGAAAAADELAPLPDIVSLTPEATPPLVVSASPPAPAAVFVPAMVFAEPEPAPTAADLNPVTVDLTAETPPVAPPAASATVSELPPAPAAPVLDADGFPMPVPDPAEG